MASLEPAATDGRGLVGLDGCEVRLCDPCARVRPCVPCVSRLPKCFVPVQVYLAVKPVGVTTPFLTRRLRIYQS